MHTVCDEPLHIHNHGHGGNIPMALHKILDGHVVKGYGTYQEAPVHLRNEQVVMFRLTIW